MPILSVNSLSIDFQVDGRWISAAKEISFTLEKGEILSLVGESGCGKSVTCMALARLLPEPPAKYSSGEIILHGKSVLKLEKKELRDLRRHRIGYIFQEPSVSLNPVFRIGDQIAEAILLRKDAGTADVKKEVIELLAQVGIADPEERTKAFPHQLSGGMQQRVMIAMALAGKPDILVADEPTTALDVTIQAQILDLLREIRENTGMSIILVTHNLGIVADMADRVLVMYAGNTVESAPTSELLKNPKHPYTQALLSAVPKLGRSSEKLATIPGSVPSPADYPEGCRFYGRCSKSEKNDDTPCRHQTPAWTEINKGHSARCHYLK